MSPIVLALLVAVPAFSLTSPQVSRPRHATERTYFPARGDRWEKKSPESVGMDSRLLNEAVAFAEAHESSFPRDFSTQEKVFGRRLGPIPTMRGGTKGLVIRKGYIVAEFGDTHAVEPMYSGAKSCLATILGLAV